MDDGKVDTDDEKLDGLAQAWFLSKYDDKAIVALREAAKLTDDGELDLRRLGLYQILATTQVVLNQQTQVSQKVL